MTLMNMIVCGHMKHLLAGWPGSCSVSFWIYRRCWQKQNVHPENLNYYIKQNNVDKCVRFHNTWCGLGAFLSIFLVSSLWVTSLSVYVSASCDENISIITPKGKDRECKDNSFLLVLPGGGAWGSPGTSCRAAGGEGATAGFCCCGWGCW